MIFKFATLVAVLSFTLGIGCSRKIDPDSADREVRKLLEDVPGFDWSPSLTSRLAYMDDGNMPNPPKDDSESRSCLRFKKDAYEDGNESFTGENKNGKNHFP